MNKKIKLFFALIFFAISFHIFSVDYAVIDKSSLLSFFDADELENTCSQISSNYDCGVYLTIVPDMKDYGYSDIQLFADYWYDLNSWGKGEKRSGIMLILSMAERDFDIFAFGYGNKVFTDYDKKNLQDTFLPYFAESKWYEGFSEFLDGVEEQLVIAEITANAKKSSSKENTANGEISENLDASSGYDIDVDFQQSDYSYVLLYGFIISLIIALIFCSYNRRKLKPVKLAVTANNYIDSSEVNILHRSDIFSHTTEVRREISDSSSNSSGGTTISSHGSSHSSGKF